MMGFSESIKHVVGTLKGPVLIVSSAVGMGNISAGEAIREELPEGSAATHIYIEDYLPRRAVKEDLVRYKEISERAPFLLNLVYRWPIFYYRKYIREIMLGASDLTALKDKIISSKARSVICISHRPSFWVSKLKAMERLDIELWGVLTEFGANFGWKYIFWQSMDVFLSVLEKRRLEYNYPEKLRYYKIEPPCRKALSLIRGTPGDVNEALLIAGYWGQISSGPAIRIIDQIVSEIAGIHITVVCGTNKKLFEKLERRFGGEPSVTVLGMVGSITALMAKSRSIITKPGFSTLAEAHSAGRQIFLLKGMPVAEDNNSDYAAKNFGAVRFSIDNFIKWYYDNAPGDARVRTEIVACPLCGERAYEVLFSDRDRSTDIRGTFNMAMCGNCGSPYLNPRPVKDDIGRLYPDDYLAYYLSPQQRIFFLIRRLPFFRLFWKHIFSRLRSQREVDLGMVRLGAESSVLDYGCGSGFFLDHIRWLTGCKVRGIELNGHARNMANALLGKDAVSGELPGMNDIGDGSIDMVSMWFVLEHLSDPSACLGETLRVLKDDGWVVIGIPNYDSWGKAIFKDRWAVYEIPRHLVFFDAKSIAWYLQKRGFEVRKFRYISSTITVIQSLEIALFGRIHQSRNRLISLGLMPILMLALWPLCLVAALFGRTDTMVVYARKADRRTAGVDSREGRR